MLRGESFGVVVSKVRYFESLDNPIQFPHELLREPPMMT